MRKEYFEPEAEWISFSEGDVIATSEVGPGELDPEDVTPAW